MLFVCSILEKQHEKRIERKKNVNVMHWNVECVRDQDSGLVVERLEEEKLKE